MLKCYIVPRRLKHTGRLNHPEVTWWRRLANVDREELMHTCNYYVSVKPIPSSAAMLHPRPQNKQTRTTRNSTKTHWQLLILPTDGQHTSYKQQDNSLT